MQIIIDSGSTSSEVVLSNEKIVRFSIGGLNPFFTSENVMKNEIVVNILPKMNREIVNNIFFYGAGCYHNSEKQKVYNYCKDGYPGSICTNLYNRLTNIQFGDEEDKFGWIEVIS